MRNERYCDYSLLENKSDDEIINLLASCVIDFSGHSNVFYISGSGGSGLPKPNFSTILSLYLSCIPGVMIIKTGSCGMTSKYGSTDLIKDLGISYGKGNIDRLWENGFLYIDSFEISPYKDFRRGNGSPFLKMQFENIFYSYSFCDIIVDNKITGIIPQAYERLKRKTIINGSKNCEYIYTKKNDKYIDECILGETYCNGKLVLKEGYEGELPSRVNIKKTNYNLLFSYKQNDFWCLSLKKGFIFYTLLLRIFSCTEEASIFFDKIIKDKLVEKKVNNLVRHYG